MIDTHCHILPNLDDGAANIEESLEMARIASADGIRRIIATPHVTGSRYSPEIIADRVAEFNRLLRQKNIPVEVYPGSEVSITLDPEKLSQYTLNNSSYILIEFPHDHLPSYAEKLLDWLCKKGLRPIIAHPERNYSIIRSPDSLFNLLNQNVYIQLTAGSVTGDYGRDIQYCAHFLLDAGKVDIIASDAHSEQLRPPILAAAAKLTDRRLGANTSLRLMHTNPEAILLDKNIHTD